MPDRIDVHTHAVPDWFRKLLGPLEGSGIPTVQWTVDDTKQMNTKLGVSTSMLSLSAPGPEISSDRDEARKIARKYNEWTAALVRSDPAHFGLFAAVPSLCDTEGVLEEVRYAFDELNVDGICVFTTYDGKYLGDVSFEPIWKELNARNAVVFVHPTPQKGYQAWSPQMFPPAFDFPHETGRTAAHMVVTGMKRKYPDIKIILSHAGGTLPILSERLAQANAHLFKDHQPGTAPQTAEELLEDMKSFYFDLAFAGTSNVLDMMLRWAPKGHLLYGSDFPYCTVEAEYNTKKMEEYGMDNEMRREIDAGNGMELFPRLKKGSA